MIVVRGSNYQHPSPTTKNEKSRLRRDITDQHGGSRIHPNEFQFAQYIDVKQSTNTNCTGFGSLLTVSCMMPQSKITKKPSVVLVPFRTPCIDTGQETHLRLAGSLMESQLGSLEGQAMFPSQISEAYFVSSMDTLGFRRCFRLQKKRSLDVSQIVPAPLP